MTVNFDAIPDELKYLVQWVVWKYEDKGDGRLTKVPYNPVRGNRASSTDPNDWTQYHDAMRVYEDEDNDYDGIGFVFTESDPYIGVDLDDCFLGRNVSPDDRITPLEAGWVEDLDSYTEVSPSGTGLKVIFRGQLPADLQRHSWGGNGIYSSGRFFTITGDVLDRRHSIIRAVASDTMNALLRVWFPPVASRQAVEEVEQRLTDWEILDHCDRAANSDKFWDLYYRGDFSDWYGAQGHSEADAGLIGMLAFYTGPCPEQLDRLFRNSHLMRDKWDERRGDETYGSRTIRMVLERMDEYYEGGNMVARGIVGPNPLEEVKLPSATEAKRRWKKLQDGYETPTTWPKYINLVAEHVQPLAERLGPDWIAIKVLSFMSALCGHVQIENRPLGLWSIGISTQATGKSATSDELEKVTRGVASLMANNLSVFTGGSESGLIHLIGGTGRNVLSYLSEWSGLAKLLGEDHSSRLRELLLNLWDGRDYTHTLATEIVQVRNPFLVVAGVTTPASWKQAVDYSDTGNGFYSRFLFVAPDVRPASSDEYPYRTRMQRERVITALFQHLSNMPKVEMATLDSKPSPALQKYSESLGLTRTSDAIDLDEVGYSHEDTNSNLPGTRLREQVKRMATVLELFEESPQIRGGVLRVREANVERAVAMVQRSAAYAQRCYGWLARSKDAEQAHIVRLALGSKSDSLYGLVSRTALNGADVERALNLLASEGLVRTVVDGEKRIYSLNGGH